MASEILFGLFALILQYCVSAQISSSDGDLCPQCTPYTCRRISGIYTVTVLTIGTYNPVVEIPASACNINITEFAHSDNYIAMNTKRGDGIINAKWALDQPGQYYGAGTRFSYDRRSGTCKGSCIYSVGPTTKDVLVQILYYDKNPGITYEFVLPNNVPFDPLNGIAVATSSVSTSGSSEGLPRKLTFARKEPANKHRSRSRAYSHRQRGVGRHHRQHRTGEADSLRERHPEPQDSWSGGRPDITSAAEGGPPQVLSFGTSYGSHTLGGRGLSYTYGGPTNSDSESKTRSKDSWSGGRPEETSAAEGGSPQVLSVGTSYGSHTLGGRGLSYTYGRSDSSSSESKRKSKTNTRSSRRRNRTLSSGRHVIERYRPGSSRRLDNGRRRGSQVTANYIRTPRYQSYSGAATSYVKSDNTISRYNRGPLRASSTLDDNNKQYRWKISGFSECSHTCGGGYQKTTIVCVSLGGRTQVVVTPENCANHLKPSQQTVACNKKPCPPAWEAEAWSECSVTCGSGTQTRKVECRQRFSSTLTLKVSADDCGLSLKPAVAQQCDMGLCSRWNVGPWSECEECGDGERRREVRCLDVYDSPIPANYCTDARPVSTEPCETKPCSVNWWMTDWSPECSASCGEGKRTRRALCMNDQGTITNDRLCENKELPVLEDQCRSDIGCRGTWFTGAWGKCSSDCGQGVHYRQVVCVHRTSPDSQGQLTVTSDAECDASVKPKTEETCFQADCDAVWFSGPWSQCSVTCGDGYMSRDVRCIIEDKNDDDSDGNESSLLPRQSTLCVSDLRPDTRKVCSQGPCPREPRYQRTNRYDPNKYDAASYVGDRGRQYTAGAFVESSREGSRYLSNEDQSSNESDDVNDKRNGLTDRYSSAKRGGFKRRTGRKPNGSAKRCSDKIDKCRVVLQARLCPYPYYQRVCCHSCQKYVLKR
ncbi:thrombospondin type-1 domain-containing protein [Plakobranchus ocellatus]|uniref:Thrombospondin type-1 domain-containing protein n=1 Tax=Plakobranchus ocellatus TaxID=259542 RepID=A0AAV4D1K5_9GAST|nr:thrombospondin type-1 domain-containing protein [Plakobranchus ocellatus]